MAPRLTRCPGWDLAHSRPTTAPVPIASCRATCLFCSVARRCCVPSVARRTVLAFAFSEPPRPLSHSTAVIPTGSNDHRTHASVPPANGRHHQSATEGRRASLQSDPDPPTVPQTHGGRIALLALEASSAIRRGVIWLTGHVSLPLLCCHVSQDCRDGLLGR